jgi:hypothetical protein
MSELNTTTLLYRHVVSTVKMLTLIKAMVEFYISVIHPPKTKLDFSSCLYFACTESEKVHGKYNQSSACNGTIMIQLCKCNATNALVLGC